MRGTSSFACPYQAICNNSGPLGRWAGVGPAERARAAVSQEYSRAPHSEWALFHALISPLLEARTLNVEQLGETSFLVRLVLQNSGWLPTNVTEKALERKAVRDIEVDLDLPDGARAVAGEVKTAVGQLKGRVDKRSTTWWLNDESTSDLAKLEWVVEAVAGTEIGIEVRHPRAGTLRRRITLE